MPVDPVKSAVAIENGLAAVCAFCEMFWVAQDQGRSGCGQKCGGPMSGGAFDKYQGPITDFSNFCFICGDMATHAIRARGNLRVLGCCSAHVDKVKQWKPVDRESVNITIISDAGQQDTFEVPVPPTKARLKIL